MTKLVKDLQIGDRVIEEKSGKTVRITNLSRGFYSSPSTLIEWRDGWSCQLDTVEVICQ